MSTNDQNYWLKCGIRCEHLDATFANYQTDTPERAAAKRAAEAFCRGEGVFAILSGTYGSGKSHLGAAIIRHFGSGAYVTNAEILNLYRMLPFNGDGVTKATLHNTLSTCKVLVLDELGASSGGVDENTLLDEVLCFRHGRMLPTVLISNAGLDRLAAFLGGRLMDRVNEGAMIIPEVRVSNRTPGARTMRSEVPMVRFSGALPKVRLQDPPRWREWLQIAGRSYERYDGAMQLHQSNFAKWLKEQSSES